MTRRIAASVLFSALALLASETARAQSAPALELRWQAPAGCPHERAVRERVEQLAGPKNANEAQIDANGAITQTDDGHFHLKLVVRTGGLVGERRIESKSCEQLAGAAAVALSLLMHSGKPLTAGVLGDSSQANNGATSAASSSGARSTSNTANGDGPEHNGDPERKQRTSESSSGSASGRSAEAPDEGPHGVRRWRARLQGPLAGLGIGPLRARVSASPSLAVSRSTIGVSFSS